MMIRSPVLRASKLLHSRIAYNYMFKALHDPSKHAYMNKFPHNVYLDYWPIGQYPETYIVGSVPSAAYQQKAQKIVAETIKSVYNTDVKSQDLLDLNFARVSSKSLKDAGAQKQFFDAVLPRLASQIFVKQSRWTWIKEQQRRLSVSSNLIIQKNPKTVKQFLQAYNQVIETLVNISNFGYSGKIQHQYTAQQKHYFRELNTTVEGIQDLRDKSKVQNVGLINRFMKLLHTI